MTGRLRRTIGVLLLFGALTVLMTWPQAAYLSTQVPSFDDSLLSVWRISWIAHALWSAPEQLVNGNIFHPEMRTLAYTDAVLLQGMSAAPFIHAGYSPVAVYNVLILASIALSGAAMCLYVQRLTKSLAAGIVSGVIFAYVPFRFDHFMHLELQATVFPPLALWFLDRAFETRRWRDVIGFGASMVLQVLSGIYYSVFLATALAVLIPVRLVRMTRADRTTLVLRLAAVTVAAGIILAPYLRIYMLNRTTVGERAWDQVEMYSATPINYLSAEPRNVVHGGWSESLGRSERRLFPGFVALTLAAIGLAGWHARKTSLAIVGVVGLILSLGVNTPIYEMLREVVFTYRGLRAPARAAILVFLSVGAFAGYGWATVLAWRPRWRTVGTALLVAVLCAEYANPQDLWLKVSDRPGATARWLAQQPRSVIVELPLPTADRLDTIYDGLYMYASTFHWQPTLNGYSGFYPNSYIELIEVMRGFPSEEAIDYLKRRNVDFVILHGSLMEPDEFGEWAAWLTARDDVRAVAEFQESGGADLVFRMVRKGSERF